MTSLGSNHVFPPIGATLARHSIIGFWPSILVKKEESKETLHDKHSPVAV